MRRFLLFIVVLGAFPCIMFAQSYFGNFGSGAKPAPTYKSTQATMLPAPIPTIASPQEFRSTISKAASSDQNRIATQYQELLAKQPPLPQRSPTLSQPQQPMTAQPPQTQPATTSIKTTTTTVKPAEVEVVPPPTQLAPTPPQVQIETRTPATTTTTTTQTLPPPPPSNDSLLQPPKQTEVYTGFQAPKNQGTQGGTQTNKQGGWNIKY